MPRRQRKEGLSRRHRYAGRGAFEQVLRSPVKLRGSWMILHVAPRITGAARFGIAVPARLVGSAVGRNALKRLGREVFRRHAAKTALLDIVLAPRKSIRDRDKAPWRAELVELLDRALERR